VAGDACMGVVLVIFAALGILPTEGTYYLSHSFGFSFFLLLAAGLGWAALRPASFFHKKE